MIVLVLSKKAAYAALLLHPHLGIHLLKLVTVRLLQNAGLREDQLGPVADPPARVPARLGRRLMERLGRHGRIALIVALGAVPLGTAIYQPLYILLDRDAPRAAEATPPPAAAPGAAASAPCGKRHPS